MLKHLTKDKLKANLREASRTKFVEEVGSNNYPVQAMNALRESMGEDKLVDWVSRFDEVNLKEARKAFHTSSAFTKLQEAGISEAAYTAFTVMGVDSIVKDGYGVPDFPLADQILRIPSKQFAQPYAWNARVGMPSSPSAVDQDTRKQLAIAPRTLVVANQRFDNHLSLSRDLVDDDQTGEFMRASSEMGKNYKEHEDIYLCAMLLGTAFTHSGVAVPAFSYNDPDGTTSVYTTTTPRQNAITAAALSQGAVQSLLTLAYTIKDWTPDQKLINVRPNALVVGPSNAWVGAGLLNSKFWPSSMSGASTQTVTGTFMTPNPLDPAQGVLRAPLDLIVEPHFDNTTQTGNVTTISTAWFIIQTKTRGIVLQDRLPLELVMESPNAGQSIANRSMNWYAYRRYATAIVDARYQFRGNDGSV